MPRLRHALSASLTPLTVPIGGRRELKHPWTLIFLAFTTPPGVVALLELLTTGHVGYQSAGPLAWLSIVALIMGRGIRDGFREAKQLNRVAAGSCPCCGYDLRASPERCPECGTTPAAK